MSNTSAESPATTPLKLLWLNPVNTSTYDQEMADMLARANLRFRLSPTCATGFRW